MKALLLAAALVAAGTTHAQNAQTTTWKLATGYRADTFHAVNAMEFGREVEAATGGQLRIVLHANNSLARLAEIPQAVQDGRAEAGETIMTSMVREIPVMGADAVPFVVASYADAWRLWQLQKPLVERHFSARGLQVLYTVPWPPQGLFTRKPIRTAADFAGTRMRTYNATTERIAQLLGATPVDVPMVDVDKALASGAIDSMLTSAVTGVDNQVWNHLRYYYEINAWFPKNVVFVQAAAFAALKPAAQQAVRKAAQAAEERGWQRSQDVMKQSTETLRANGMKTERMPREFELELKRMGERFAREWVRTVGNEANVIFVPYYTQ